MPLLATFTFAGAASLAGMGNTSFTHGLPTTPDWAAWIAKGTGAAAVASLPAGLITRTPTVVVLGTFNSGMDGELVAQFVHAIQR